MILKSLATFMGEIFHSPSLALLPFPLFSSRGSGFLGQIELLDTDELNKLALEDMSEVRPGGRSNSFEYCV